MKRGEVWWAYLAEPHGKRPVVLLSRNESYNVRSHVIVAVVTRTMRNIPVEVALGKEDGLPKDCVVTLDSIVTIHKDLLKEKIASLGPHKINEINRAIVFSLGLAE